MVMSYMKKIENAMNHHSVQKDFTEILTLKHARNVNQTV
jgi:hypothetical protein